MVYPTQFINAVSNRRHQTPIGLRQALWRLTGVLAVLTLWSVALASPSGADDTPPNFIVVFCDDLGYGDLGCFGHPTIATPNLDRLAGEGQRWTSFYVGAPVCTPSRAALMTGRVPVRSGMMSAKRRVLFPNSKGGLPASEVTIAEVLKQRGYATGCVGKWHLGHLPEYLPPNHGFDSYWGIPYSNDMDHKRGFPSYIKQAKLDPNYMPPAGQYAPPIIEGLEEFERPADQRTLTRRYTEKAIDFVRANHEQPFFLYLAHSLPHIPLHVGDAHRGTSRRGLYGDVVEEIDAGVGQIIDTLKELEIDDNTMVVFTSDNGPWYPFETHGGTAGLLRGAKGDTFEGGMREPTVVWGPGYVKPRVVMEMGATMDLLPTFAAMAGAELPEDLTLDGYDLSGVITGTTEKSPRDRMFYWRQEKLYAVRQGPWKAHFIMEGSYQTGEKRQVPATAALYHLEYDPGEKYDMAEQHPDVIERLTALANEHRESIQPVENQLMK